MLLHYNFLDFVIVAVHASLLEGSNFFDNKALISVDFPELIVAMTKTSIFLYIFLSISLTFKIPFHIFTFVL